MPRRAPVRGPVEGNALLVSFVSRQRRYPVDRRRIRRVLEGAARSLGAEGELCLVLASDRLVRDLNARYRGKDRATDVLSFPAPGGELGLGDVILSVPTASRNARARGARLQDELELLALHGFLHALGYDHETDDGQMERLERRLRRALLGARA